MVFAEDLSHAKRYMTIDSFPLSYYYISHNVFFMPEDLEDWILYAFADF